MPRPEPVNRQRKRHNRSRNGCKTCKLRHLRCDQRRPLCTYCLRRGGECGYNDASTTSTDQPDTTLPTEKQYWDSETLPLHGMVTAHDLDDLSITLTDESRSLLGLLRHYSAPLSTMGNNGCYDSPLISCAFSQPEFLPSAILMAAVQYSWITHSISETNRTSTLHHRLEAVRFVNNQLQDPTSMTSNATISTVVSLALAESALGCFAAAQAHLNGLAQIMSMRHPGPTPRISTRFSHLLQCLEQMSQYFKGPNKTETLQKWGQHDCMAKTSSCALVEPQPETIVLKQEGDFDSDSCTIDPRLVEKPLPEQPQKKPEQEPKQEPERPPERPEVALRRATFVWCCVNLFEIIQRDDVDLLILSWLLEGTLFDLVTTESHVAGQRLETRVAACSPLRTVLHTCRAGNM
ncbi:uncharacterized protein BCR38DRAFT_426200 [Pseudomassariella vexata]|uniref:Zn(2)-C6 fungal-type domain-containing protein n=1 Tax=Pseudomassariella vexata TaxID=1141098 RepID=A0A1Y2E6K7_9PEZI|nr:uncharacterized protein BCR38DRAFT_426200 [Pseudomassariella vexata]ORY67149.1 hypothetical protein BCR38DRAFT_426200 [Pseudomassariella vexata]